MAVVIACVQTKGGPGKSTVARLLAVELARRRHAVVLVDLNGEQATVSEWRNTRDDNGIAPSVTVETVDADDEHDFRIPELSKRFDFIVCDAPGWSDRMTLRLAEKSNLVIFPSNTTIDDMRPAIRLYHELSHAGIAPERMAVVLNFTNSEADIRGGKSYFAEASVGPVIGSLPYQLVYKDAQDVGLALSEAPGAPGEKATALAKALIKCATESGKRVEPKRFTLKAGESW